MKLRDAILFIWIFAIPLLLIAQGSSQILMPGKLMKAHERFEKACDACHDKRGVNATLCLLCHKEINSSRHGENCLLCHDEHRGINSSGLKQNIGKIEHANFGYSLDNHENLKCNDCHNHGFKRNEVERACISCHNRSMNISEHLNIFGSSCLNCHRNGETSVKNFDHSRVGYYIDKHHYKLSCNDCHKNSFKRSEITCDSLLCHSYFKIKKEHAEHGIDYKAKACFECHKGKKKKENKKKYEFEFEDD